VCFQSERLAARVAGARSTAGAWQTLVAARRDASQLSVDGLLSGLLIALNTGSARATGSLGCGKEEKIGFFTHEHRQATKLGG
jgi:hypothetical protein